MNGMNSTQSPDPYLMSMQQKREFFERSWSHEQNNNPIPITKSPSLISLPASVPRKTRTEPSFASTSTPTPIPVRRQQFEKPKQHTGSSTPSSCSVSRIINNLNNSSSNSSQTLTRSKSVKVTSSNATADASNSSLYMKEFHDVFRDLDTFIGKELNEIECRKRLGMLHKDALLKEFKNERNIDLDEEIRSTLKKLKDDVHEIRENQKGFEEKMRKHELNQIFVRKKNEIDTKEKEKIAEETHKKIDTEEKAVQYSIEAETITPLSSSSRIEFNDKLEKLSEMKQQQQQAMSISNASSNSSIATDGGFSRNERIKRLKLEIYKEETLLTKINRVLESVKQIDERNLSDIIDIERHYLVASTRFQSALSELQKLNGSSETARLPPFSHKGKLYVRDIMLEVKSSYFQRAMSTSNEFLVAVMKYEDKVYATRPIRIKDDIRILKFAEKFSIPEIYMDFDMRLEIYGTTFWRKNNSVRDTMLKKYGFVTFSLADTGNKPKRFSMIETLQSDNVPIRSKIMMKISQKITTDVKYKGNLYIKLRDIWHETNARLNGHLLEFTFTKKHLGSDYIRSQETMLLDLYNADCDAVVHVDSRRISEKSFAFLIKFNHYVDVTNFYIMVAADNEEHYIEWVGAINKVLALIK